MKTIKAYDPNQPRVPAGSEDGETKSPPGLNRGGIVAQGWAIKDPIREGLDQRLASDLRSACVVQIAPDSQHHPRLFAALEKRLDQTTRRLANLIRLHMIGGPALVGRFAFQVFLMCELVAVGDDGLTKTKTRLDTFDCLTVHTMPFFVLRGFSPAGFWPAFQTYTNPKKMQQQSEVG